MLQLYYTRHARSMMRWRDISKEKVKQTIENPEKHEILSPHKFHYFRQFGKSFIRVTLVIENEKIIIISVVDKNN